MSYTKRDYEAIAEALGDATGVADATTKIADYFEQSNERFKRDQFLKKVIELRANKTIKATIGEPEPAGRPSHLVSGKGYMVRGQAYKVTYDDGVRTVRLRSLVGRYMDEYSSCYRFDLRPEAGTTSVPITLIKKIEEVPPFTRAQTPKLVRK